MTCEAWVSLKTKGEYQRQKFKNKRKGKYSKKAERNIGGKEKRSSELGNKNTSNSLYEREPKPKDYRKELQSQSTH